MRVCWILVAILCGCAAEEELPPLPPKQVKQLELSPPLVPEPIGPPHEVEPGGVVTPPIPLVRVEPRWGNEAPRALVLEVLIDERGEVRRVFVPQNADGWTRRAGAALYRWRFAPATIKGKPVAVFFDVKIEPDQRGGA